MTDTPKPAETKKIKGENRMKKIIALILAAVFMLSFVGCNNNANTSTEYFDEALSSARGASASYLFSNSLNSKKLDIYYSTEYLPIFKFDTLEELKSFKSESGIQYKHINDINLNYLPSLNEVTSKYDEEFFNENSLILVYITSGSGSFRYGVDSVYISENTFNIHVERTNNPLFHTSDMAYLFITVAIPDSIIENCTIFDAIMETTIKVKNISDNSEGQKIFDAPECFYSDESYNYYFSKVIGEYVIVTYADGTTENVRDAFDKGHINLNDLDEFGIVYTKEEKTTTE